MSKQYPGGLITKSPVTPSGPYSNDTASGIWTLDQQAYWQKLGQWPTAGNNPVDPQFNYVTMLLHGDGTNGAQNNTFLDSSGNSLSIIRVGNVTQGSFSPYGSNWSNYFDGTGDRLSIASASALNIGSADMTMEFWMLIPSAFPSDYRVLFAKGTNTSGGNSYAIEGMSSGVLTLYVNTDGSSGWNLFSGTTIGTPTIGAWNHVVVCRSGTTWYSFMNGTRVLNTTGAGTVTASSTAVTIGDFGTAGFEYTGYISNLRLVNGTAIYANATTCTVPTTPLTAVTNTSLLTCQSNRFIDNSTNAFAITTTGTPSVQRFNPFGASTAYSTSVIGGSGYFDGTGDYLNVGNNLVLRAGTSDFTFESWVYSNGEAGSEFIADFGSSNVNGWGLYDEGAGGNLQFRIADVDRIAVAPLVARAWSHVAIVRSGTTATLYVNGISVGSYGSAGTNLDYTGNSYIGTQVGSNIMNGYLSDVRLVKGTAVYTSNFTPPTAPLTAITNTSLLLSMTNGAIFDNAMMNDLETVGNAQISTSVKKYGTGSLAFDGTGDYLVPRASPNNSLGSGNFTIECWVNPSIVNNNAICGLGNVDNTDTSSFFLRLENGYVNFYTTGNNRYAVTYTSGSWYHLAVVRSSGTVSVYWDGTQIGSGISITNNFSSTDFYVASGKVTGTIPYNEFNGYIDDFRITKGFARYTANFTPPTAAFFNYGPT